MKKQKDEQHLAEKSAKKARKAAEKRRMKVPWNRTHVGRPTPTKPAHLVGQPSGTARPCHLAAWPSVPVWLGLAVLRGSGSMGLPCNSFSQLFSSSWHSFLLNVVHLSVSSIKFLEISKDVKGVKSMLKETDLTLPSMNERENAREMSQKGAKNGTK